MHTYVALLRGINVGGHNKVPMAKLRALCEEAGMKDVRTYIQSGNLVLQADGDAADVSRKVGSVVAKGFGFDAAVVVRTAAEWKAYAAEPPFKDAAAERPNLLHLCLSTEAPDRGAVQAIEAKASGDERIIRQGDAIWIDFASGAGRSKITPTVLDKAVGSSVTARNWNTVQKIAGMLDE